MSDPLSWAELADEYAQHADRGRQLAIPFAGASAIGIVSFVVTGWLLPAAYAVAGAAFLTAVSRIVVEDDEDALECRAWAAMEAALRKAEA